MVIFDQRAAGQIIRVDDVARIGRIELRLKSKDDQLTLAGAGRLAIHGAETIRNKYSTAIIQTGILLDGLAQRRHRRRLPGSLRR